MPGSSPSTGLLGRIHDSQTGLILFPEVESPSRLPLAVSENYSVLPSSIEQSNVYDENRTITTSLTKTEGPISTSLEPARKSLLLFFGCSR